MTTIMSTRWMRWRKEWKSLVCWLLVADCLDGVVDEERWRVARGDDRAHCACSRGTN